MVSSYRMKCGASFSYLTVSRQHSSRDGEMWDIQFRISSSSEMIQELILSNNDTEG
jgi:hypothetical protein